MCFECWIIIIVSVVVGWCSRVGAIPPCPHAVAVLPPLPNALRNGKLAINAIQSVIVYFKVCFAHTPFPLHLKIYAWLCM